MKMIEIPEQTPASEVDPEILEIFVEEMQEVLETIISHFDAWRDNATDDEALKVLRRAFHTLKGSGRLVGATAIGELGWCFESMLNHVIEGTLNRNDAMLKLIAQVEDVLPELIEQFQNTQPTPQPIVVLISQVHHFIETKGQEITEAAPASARATPAKPVAKPVEKIVTPQPVKEVAAVTQAKPTSPVAKPVEKVVTPPRTAKEIAAVTKAKPMPPVVKPATTPVEKVITPRTAKEVAAVTKTKPTPPVVKPATAPVEKVVTPRTAKEVAAVTETKPLPSAAKPAAIPIEKIEEIVIPEPHAAGLPIAEIEFVRADTATFEEVALDDQDLAPVESLEISDTDALLVEAADLEFENGAADAEMLDMSLESMAVEELTPATVLELETSDLDFDAEMQNFEASAEELTALAELAPGDSEISTQDNLTPTPSLYEKITATEETETEVINPVLIDIFRKEASQHLVELKEALAICQQAPSNEAEQSIMRAFHTLNGSSRSVNFSAISAIAAPLESYMRELSERQLGLTVDRLPVFEEATVLIESLLNGDFLDEKRQTALLKQVQTALESLSESVAKVIDTKSTGVVKVDEGLPEQNDEFMAIFLEEAEEILENTQSLLERWQATPNNMQLMKELQRELHTLKGGSRMVGIAPMGDLSHHLESVLTQIVEGNAQSNTRLQEIVQNSVDELAAMSEAVRSGVPLDMPNDLINLIHTAISVNEGSETVAAVEHKPVTEDREAAPPPKPIVEEPEPIRMDRNVDKDSDSDAGEDRIRVRVTLIDKLTSLAGELSISRAHLEQQQAAVKNNLSEMEQTVVRLRDQLRRLEIETEAQIFSHYGRGLFGQRAIKDNKEFDPLELDRFSVMQQLSRALMESISDLVSIQDFLKTLTRQTDTLLIQQSRIGAELQEGIMRTRMVPFARISPRLQRICRLTARELRKQVDFDINGENIEFERAMLNRMVAPLEHMLRNAIGHGIEDAETRQQAGKPTVAKITVDLAKEGPELIIKLRDDGAGLNLVAIRKKAEERGLLKPGTVISDHELMQFIFESGFSTAKEISLVSGRGVGMDVVNNEIKQLSGSVQIHSKTGQGTVFEIRLPLSLTINQALLVHIGEETLAIPLNNVEAVLRLPRADVLTERNDDVRHYKYMDNDYRVFHLGELLGFGRQGITDSPLIPTLLVRAGNRRVALVVDGIEGSKEVVVKSVGPQIGSIRWITGATILGDGRVVLILDVGALARADTPPQPHPKEDVVVPIPVPVIDEKPVATIMVVDDSITVRKVTARLLKRQGMEVLTAKDGVDAVAQLQEHVPDLMLLDVEMPRMDGYELATQMRNTPNLKHIPIIMITTRTGVKHRDKAEKIGINRYLGKPFKESELLENINALLAEKISADARMSS